MARVKISKDTIPGKAAGAIEKLLNEEGSVDVVAIGASAVNQAAKAIAVANIYSDNEIVCTPYFEETEVDGNQRTSMRFTCVKAAAD